MDARCASAYRRSPHATERKQAAFQQPPGSPRLNSLLNWMIPHRPRLLLHWESLSVYRNERALLPRGARRKPQRQNHFARFRTDERYWYLLTEANPGGAVVKIVARVAA